MIRTSLDAPVNERKLIFPNILSKRKSKVSSIKFLRFFIGWRKVIFLVLLKTIISEFVDLNVTFGILQIRIIYVIVNHLVSAMVLIKKMFDIGWHLLENVIKDYESETIYFSIQLLSNKVAFLLYIGMN